MNSNVISLPTASPSENLQALAEVSDFGTTNMGHTDQGPWTYRILQEPLLSAELNRLSNPHSWNRFVDSVTFQPCPSYVARTQDRYVVEQWDLPGGKWLFNAILDGHLNHHTVEHVQGVLPSAIKGSLHSALNKMQNSQLDPNIVSKLLHDSVIRLDNSISSEFLDLFPQDPEKLSCMTDSEVRRLFHDGVSGDRSYNAASRCMGGVTVVLSLTDPRTKNLWVANLGDSRAVIGLRSQSGGWSGTLINAVQNASEPLEVQRIRAEHPGEKDSVKNNRLLGFLEPTRAIGDTWLKIPALYAHRVFSNLNQEWISPERIRECASRILTPPYVSNLPDVYHHILPNSPSFLVLCSDGLPELYEMDPSEMVDHWVKIVGRTLDSQHCQGGNRALCLLRDAIGGDDLGIISQNLTVEMEERWMDDTTIIIQSFHHQH